MVQPRQLGLVRLHDLIEHQIGLNLFLDLAIYTAVDLIHSTQGTNVRVCERLQFKLYLAVVCVRFLRFEVTDLAIGALFTPCIWT